MQNPANIMAGITDVDSAETAETTAIGQMSNTTETLKASQQHIGSLSESVYIVTIELVVLNVVWLAYFLLKTHSDSVALWFEVIFYGFTISTICMICCVLSIKLHEKQSKTRYKIARVCTILHTCAQSTAVYLVVFWLVFVMLNISLFTSDNVPQSWRQWLNGLMFAPGYEYVEPDWLVQIQVALISVLSFFGLCGLVFCVLSTLQVQYVQARHVFDLGLASRLNIVLTVVATDAWSRLLTRVCGQESCVYDASDRPFPIDDMHLFELVAWLFGFLLCDAAVYTIMKRLSEAVKLGLSDITKTQQMSKRLMPNSTISDGILEPGSNGSKSGRNLRMRLSGMSGAQKRRNKLATTGRGSSQTSTQPQDSIWHGARRFRTFEKLRLIDEQLGLKARQSAYLLFVLRCVNFAALLAFAYIYAHIFLDLIQTYLTIAFLFAVIVTAIVDTVKMMHRIDMHMPSNELDVGSDAKANAMQSSHDIAASKSLAVDLLYEPETLFNSEHSHDAYNPGSRFIETIVKKDS